MSDRQIRPSQYVTTYGSGAMLPLSSGYTIIPSLPQIINDLSERDKFDLKSFRVRDTNMEHIISRMPSLENKKAKIFQIPSNADLNIGDEISLFKTIIFPHWAVCNAHPGTPVLAHLQRISGYVGIRCPLCERTNIKRSKSYTNRGSPVRFVKACINGHLDDVNWVKEVHQNFNCPGNVFTWDESGDDINFKVSCYGYYDSNKFCKTNCDKSISYSALRYSSDQDLMECSGRFPECATREPCSQHPKLILKNASNIRLVDSVMAVLIPPVPGRLEFLYSHIAEFDRFYEANLDFTHEEFVEYCKRSNRKYGSNFPISDIEASSQSEIKDALLQIQKKLQRPEFTDLESDDERMIEEEYYSLLEATKRGFPPVKWGSTTGLHIEPTDAILFENEETGLTFKISPIRQLFLTKVQRGYSREVPIMAPEEIDYDELPIRKRNGKLISCHYDEPNTNTRWFVGHQLHGEGIFIQLCDPDDLDQQYDPFEDRDTDVTSSFNAWNQTYHKWAQRGAMARRKTNPRFVWWHTLAHKIINNLAIQSGFSSASISERIYCYEEQNNTNTSGVLLYTAQPGGDGTMGGLVSMAPHFSDLLSNVLRDMHMCSNDPVCRDKTKSPGRFNGAACHACLFVSETSCESQNKFLDRNIVLETIKNDRPY